MPHPLNRWWEWGTRNVFVGFSFFRKPLVALAAALLTPALLTAADGAAEISVTPAELSWSIYAGEPQLSGSFLLKNVGGETLDWTTATIPANAGFVVEPAGGSLEPGGTVSVSLTKDTSAMVAGSQTASLGILDPQAENHPFAIPLTVDVLDHERPVANDQQALTNADTPVPIALDFTDDGLPGSNTFTIVAPPLSGTLDPGGPGVYHYTPDMSFTGADTFSWTVHDGGKESNLATVFLGVNQIPIAEDQTVTTLEDVPTKIQLVFTDDELPGPHTATITRLPANGTLVESDVGKFTYTPAPGYYGSDSFAWKVHDGLSDSNIATVTIDVEGVPEVAFDQSEIAWTVYRGRPSVSKTLTLRNIGGADLVWTAETSPFFEPMTVTPGAGTLSPGDSVALEVTAEVSDLSDGTFALDLGILDPAETNYPSSVPVSLTILENADPTATDQLVLTSEQVPISIALDLADDGVPEPPTTQVTSPPLHGELIEESMGVYRYTPEPDFIGADHFTWTVSDGFLESSEAVATIQVNQIPIAEDQTVSTLEDLPTNIQLTFTDDGVPGPHVAVITRAPEHGTVVEFEVGKYTYTPTTGFYGSDSFTWQVHDGMISSNVATVSIDVEGVPEVWVDRSVITWTVYEGTPIVSETVTLRNIGGGDLLWEATTAPLFENLVITPDSGILAPTDAIELEITADLAGLKDGLFELAIGLLDPEETNYPSSIPVSLTIVDNESPTASDQVISTSEEIPLPIELDYTDDGLPQAPFFEIVSVPLQGTLLELGSGVYGYQPNEGFIGTDTFTWKVSDGLLESSEATATVHVNQIPVADDTEISTFKNTPTDLPLTYIDDGLPGPYTITITDWPNRGTLVEVESGQYVYLPTDEFSGTDQVSWTVHDGLIESAVATVTIQVEGVAETNCAQPVDTIESCSLLPSGCWIEPAFELTHLPWLVEPKSPGFLSNVNRYRAFCSPANATPGTGGHWYSYSIYLPEGYDLAENQHIEYPVVYWLHESIGAPNEFRNKQGASRDRVQSRHLGRHILPTIYVFPYGGSYSDNPYAEFEWIDQWSDGFQPGEKPGCDPDDPGRCFKADSAFDELIEHIETNYRVVPESAARGIEGFSRGGGFALQRAFRPKDGEYYFGSVAALSASAEWERYRYEPNARELSLDYANAFPVDEDRPIELLFLTGDADLDQAVPPMASFSKHLLEEIPDLSEIGVDPVFHTLEEVVPDCGEESGYPPPCPPGDMPPPLGHDWLRMDRLRGDEIVALHQASFERMSSSYLDALDEHRMPCAGYLGALQEEPPLGDPHEEYIVGDWNGDSCDTVAVRADGSFFFDNDLDDEAETVTEVGPDGAAYFAIDWRDIGTDELGWAEFSPGICPGSWAITLWTEDADGDGHGPEDEPTFCFEDVPEYATFHVGDFDGDWLDDLAFRDGNEIAWTPFQVSGYDGRISGTTSYGTGLEDDQYAEGTWAPEQTSDAFGVRRDSTWFLNDELDPEHDISIDFGDGESEDQYLTGDWNGSGRTNLAYRRCNKIFLDVDLDGVVDHHYFFGSGTGGCHCTDSCL